MPRQRPELFSLAQAFVIQICSLSIASILYSSSHIINMDVPSVKTGQQLYINHDCIIINIKAGPMPPMALAVPPVPEGEGAHCLGRGIVTTSLSTGA